MKTSKFFSMGVLAVTLVLGLALTGCPTEDDKDSGGNGTGGSSSLTGIWTGTLSMSGDSAAATVNITTSGWTLSCPSISLNESGTYTVSGNIATLQSNGATIGAATLASGVLTVAITSGSYTGASGTFTK
jgi:hypothetical protein